MQHITYEADATLRFLDLSQDTATMHASIVSAAFPRYIVRTPSGSAMQDQVTGRPVETDDIAFANAARYNCDGVIVDRWDWRNSSSR